MKGSGIPAQKRNSGIFCLIHDFSNYLTTTENNSNIKLYFRDQPDLGKEKRRVYREKQAYDEDRKYAVKSRRRVLERELKSLKRLMYGGNIRIWEYLSDYWGDYSEEQTNVFVEQVIDEEHYQRIHTFDHAGYLHKFPFYRKLLYCVLRTLTAGYTHYQNGNVTDFGEPEKITFFDVVSSFQGVHSELLDVDIVYFMRILYEILEQKEIDLALLNPGSEEPEMTEDSEKQMLVEIESWEALEEEKLRELGASVEEWRAGEQEAFVHEKARQMEEENRIRETFPEREHFCRSLEEILLYLKENSVRADELETEIRELLFQFLSDRRLSVLDEEEAFVEVMVQLKKTIRTAQRYLEE